MPEDTNASTAPVCTPAMRPLMARGLASPSPPPVITRIDRDAAWIHSGRSTMRASGIPPPSVSPVTSRTGSSDARAESASWSITCVRV